MILIGSLCGVSNMWTFRAPNGVAIIAYDSMSGGFLANVNGKRLGPPSFTPQDSVKRILQVVQEDRAGISVPNDLSLWEQTDDPSSW